MRPLYVIDGLRSRKKPSEERCQGKEYGRMAQRNAVRESESRGFTVRQPAEAAVRYEPPGYSRFRGIAGAQSRTGMEFGRESWDTGNSIWRYWIGHNARRWKVCPAK